MQAYALYKKIEDMGFNCEELNYTQIITNKLLKLVYRFHRIFEILSDLGYETEMKKSLSNDGILHEEYLKMSNGDVLKYKFDLFIQNNFKTTKLYNPSNIRRIDKDYDFYITGGDQVWNPDWTDSNYFLKFAKQGRKIAYSCSAGKDNFSYNDKKKIKKYIKNLDVISVREKNFSEMLNKESIENKIIADPVFLFDKKFWEDFSDNIEYTNEKYIFAYLLGNDKERRDQIKIFAKKNNLKIVSIPNVFRKYNKFDDDFADIKVSNAGPREFVSLIKNSEFVMTDSFHGTSFSIIFEKQFLNFSRFSSNDTRSLNVRLKNVLFEYDLQNRMVDVSNISKISLDDIGKIDYNKCRIVTDNKREKAIEFLKENLLDKHLWS